MNLSRAKYQNIPYVLQGRNCLLCSLLFWGGELLSSAGRLRESWPLSSSLRKPGQALSFPCGDASWPTWFPWALPTQILWVSSNLRSDSPRGPTKKSLSSFKEQCLTKARGQPFTLVSRCALRSFQPCLWPGLLLPPPGAPHRERSLDYSTGFREGAPCSPKPCRAEQVLRTVSSLSCSPTSAACPSRFWKLCPIWMIFAISHSLANLTL
jgi:hypothetical protein